MLDRVEKWKLSTLLFVFSGPVYKYLSPTFSAQGEPMRIVYRMRGLLGDATEEFIESLDSTTGVALFTDTAACWIEVWDQSTVHILALRGSLSKYSLVPLIRIEGRLPLWLRENIQIPLGLGRGKKQTVGKIMQLATTDVSSYLFLA